MTALTIGVERREAATLVVLRGTSTSPPRPSCASAS